MRLKPLVAASAVVAVGVVVVGIAYAAIPGAGGQIQGCYVTKGGALRVVNADRNAQSRSCRLPGIRPTTV
jgi:hypothetical protein